MSLAADVSWTVVFSLMITVAIIGNIIVLWIIMCMFAILVSN